VAMVVRATRAATAQLAPAKQFCTKEAAFPNGLAVSFCLSGCLAIRHSLIG